jgi:DNA-binding transcriptional LysR family regulator
VPTASGRALIAHARVIDAELRRARNEIDDIEGVRTGEIRVSASPTVAMNLLPRAILNLKAARPQVAVHIEEAVYPQVLPGVRDGDLDVAVCLVPDAASDDDLVFEVLVKDVLTPAVRSDHPLVRRRDLDLGDLVNREWVVFGRSGESRDVYEQTFRRNGFAPPKSTIDCTSFTCALALVEKSDYLVLAPRQIFAERRRTWTIAPLTLRTPMQPWTIAAITRAGDIPSPACREFLRQLRAVMPG